MATPEQIQQARYLGYKYGQTQGQLTPEENKVYDQYKYNPELDREFKQARDNALSRQAGQQEAASRGVYYVEGNNFFQGHYESKPKYTDALGQGVSYDPNKATPKQSNLNYQIQEAVQRGDIQGYSGRLYTNADMGKANLLSNAGLINKAPEQYGEYNKGFTKQGTSLLTAYQQSQPLNEQLPKSYVVPEKYNYPRGIEGGGGTASPITSSDIFTVASGIGGVYKGGFLLGSKILLSKPITGAVTKGIDYVIPRQDSGFSRKGSLSQIGRGALFLASTPLTGASFGYQFGKSLLESPVETIKGTIEFARKNPYEIATVTFGSRQVEKVTDFSIFGKKPYKIEPTSEMIKEVEPLSGRIQEGGTARLFLKTEERSISFSAKGIYESTKSAIESQYWKTRNVITSLPSMTKQGAISLAEKQIKIITSKSKFILGKSGGEYISIGGTVKGKTPSEALKIELKEETGLSVGQLTNLQSRGKIVFPEETMNIFTATISKENLKQIKASSDISKIKTFNPESIFLKGSTGQTGFQPISRFTFGGKVRSYEAGIINFLETGKKPTWLAIDTKQGSFILGTQSRYNVPFSSQKKFLNQEDLLLAHGTPSPTIMRRYTPFEKSDVVKGELTRRGQAQGLYVQPPISSIKGSRGYIGLSYLGFKTSQAIDYLGIKVGNKKSTAYLFKERTGGEITYTPKTLSGAEQELIIRPGTRIGSKGRAEIFSIGFKRVYAQPSRIIRGKESGRELITSRTIKDISEEGRYIYISPRELSSPVSVSLTGKSKSSISSQGVSVSKIISNISKSKSISYKSKISSSMSKPSSISYLQSTNKSYSISKSKEPSYSLSISKSKSFFKEGKKSETTSYSKIPNKPIIPTSYNYNFNNLGRKKKQKRLKGISQQIAYTPSLGASVFNLKLSNKSQLKSGKVSPFNRRGTLSLKDLRKINKGSSIF